MTSKKKKKIQEKRKAPRLKKELTVQYSVKELPPSKEVQVLVEASKDITRARDLSVKGVFFTASCAIPLQSILEIKLRIPAPGQTLDLEGRVVGCEEMVKNLIYGVRVAFINLKNEQKEKLQKFIHSLLKE